MEDNRFALLDELRRGRPTVSVMTTYSVDFAFYEGVVLRRLNAAGCQHHVLLVDAVRCGEALSDPDRRPRFAGASYSLIPVSRPGAFHPKLLVLAGKKDSRLFVGSHNLTMAGFGGNAELTNVVEARDPSSSALVRSALDAVQAWLPHGTSGGADALALARQLVGGGRAGQTDDVLLYTSPNRPCLWDQMRPLLPSRIRRVVITGPFFDGRMALVRRALSDLRGTDVTVAIDPDYGNLPPEVARALGARFVDVRFCTRGAGFPNSAHTHAKAIFIESAEGWTVVSGSANPSAAAWLDVGTNEEAVLVRRGVSHEELSRLQLGPLLEAPELTSAHWAEIANRVELESAASSTDRPVAAVTAVEEKGVVTIVGATGAKRAWLHSSDGARQEVSARAEADGSLRIEHAPIDVSRCTLAEVELGSALTFGVVNHAASLSPRSEGTNVRAELRTALGAVSEDGARIEEVLKIVERAIDEVDADALRSAGKAGHAEHAAPGGATLGSRSMSIADVRRRATRPRSLATGNVAVVIDLLIRRISEGLPAPSTTTRPAEVEESELDPLDEAARAATLQIDGHELVKACHRKLRRLMKKMVERLDTVMSSGEGAVRAIIQLAAVLGVVQWLRRIEPELSWVPFGESLIPEEPRDDLFWWSGTYLGLSQPSLIDRVLGEDPEGCDELWLALALVAWLGFEGGIDARKTSRSNTAFHEHVDEDDLPWFHWSGVLVGVLGAAFDSPALATLRDSVAQSRGVDRDGWLDGHLRLGEAAAFTAAAPESVPVLSRPVRRGDIVRIQMPNGRCAAGFAVDVDDAKVRIADASNDDGRPVLKQFVAAVDVERLVCR